MRPSHRILTTLRGCVVGICITLAAFAEDASAPAAVQGQILVRLMLYERRFVKRAPNEVVVLLLQKAGNSDSINAVGQMQKVLRDIGVINGMPIRSEVLTFGTAADLAALCQAEGASVVYVTPGFHGDAGAIAKALVGSEVVTFSAVEDYVADGITVGINVVAGRPKMSINLTQARLQGLDFASSVLNLARIY